MDGWLRQFSENVLEGVTGLYTPAQDLESQIASLSMRSVLGSAAALFFLVILARLTKDRLPQLKPPIFLLIVSIVTVTTLLISGATIYLNLKSDSGGPVHWHADMEIWACDNELELRDPTGFSNKIGTSTLHEHNDHRIHLEGVVVDKHADASLGKFMYVVNGAITNEALVVPLNSSGFFENDIDGDGATNTYADMINPYIVEDTSGTYARFTNGKTCGDKPAEVQVFVYVFDKAANTYSQSKLENPRDYVIRDDSLVPPGDCIIIEFAPKKDFTNRLCEQYGVRDAERCEQFGVAKEDKAVCDIKQVTKGGR